MSEPIKVGSIVTFPGDDRHWRTVYVDVDRGFARLEHATNSGVLSKVVDLDTLMVIVPDSWVANRTSAQIIREFAKMPW